MRDLQVEKKMRFFPSVRMLVFLSVAGCVGASPALAWTAAEQVATYPVYGQSGPELYQSIGENGPVISGNRRTIAHTTFKLTWGRDYRERGDGSCVIAANNPKLIITYTLPKPRGSMPSSVASSWKRFADGLAAHERVHGQHIIEMVQAIEAVSVGLSQGAGQIADPSQAAVGPAARPRPRVRPDRDGRRRRGAEPGAGAGQRPVSLAPAEQSQ